MIIKQRKTQLRSLPMQRQLRFKHEIAVCLMRNPEFVLNHEIFIVSQI